MKKPGLLKAHPLEAGDPFDSGSEASEGSGPCVSSLSALIGTVAETSEEKYRLLDQRDRIMRQGTGATSARPQGSRREPQGGGGPCLRVSGPLRSPTRSWWFATSRGGECRQACNEDMFLILFYFWKKVYKALINAKLSNLFCFVF